jgi:hypothetical protein
MSWSCKEPHSFFVSASWELAAVENPEKQTCSGVI